MYYEITSSETWKKQLNKIHQKTSFNWHPKKETSNTFFQPNKKMKGSTSSLSGAISRWWNPGKIPHPPVDPRSLNVPWTWCRGLRVSTHPFGRNGSWSDCHSSLALSGGRGRRVSVPQNGHGRMGVSLLPWRIHGTIVYLPTYMDGWCFMVNVGKYTIYTWILWVIIYTQTEVQKRIQTSYKGGLLPSYIVSGFSPTPL